MKPESPLLDAAVRLVGSTKPLVVGDRLDTDIACAVGADTPSLLVFTGVSTAADVLAAPPSQRPTYLAFDMRGLVDEDRVVRIPSASLSGGGLEWTVTTEANSLVLGSNQTSDGTTQVSDASALRALAMLTARAWATGSTDYLVHGAAAAAALERCGLMVTAAA